MIARFRHSFPGVTFDLRVTVSTVTNRLIQEGTADVGVTLSHSPLRGLTVERMTHRSMYAVMPSGHPLAKRRSVSMADIVPFPVALPEPSTQRNLIYACCNSQGLVLEPVLSTNSVAVLRRFAAAEGCIQLTSAHSKRGPIGTTDFAAVPVVDPGLIDNTVRVVTLRGRTLPAAARAFLDLLLTEMAEGAIAWAG
ncbi:LysR substrate-binding domain-containing protein [Bradyrhizobium genosp. P]|uniref:LysR substrate-binding domain-containing protein n=1 Tax=Bradyrhizobium genosp. P TaxID=83641 RepID=UPI003CF56AF3